MNVAAQRRVRKHLAFGYLYGTGTHREERKSWAQWVNGEGPCPNKTLEVLYQSIINPPTAEGEPC